MQQDGGIFRRSDGVSGVPVALEKAGAGRGDAVAQGKQRTVPAEQVDGLVVVVDGLEGFALDRRAEAHFHAASALVDELVGQEQGAEAGIDDPGQVEADAVGAGDEGGNALGAGHAGDARHVAVPLGIEDAAVVAAPGGDFAGGKDDEQVSLLDPVEGLANAFAIGALVAFAHHVVDQDAVGGQLFHAAEQLVGQHFDVGTQAQQQSGHHDAIQHAKGMIGEDDAGAFGGHVLEVRLAHGVLDVHLAQETVEDVSAGLGYWPGRWRRDDRDGGWE